MFLAHVDTLIRFGFPAALQTNYYDYTCLKKKMLSNALFKSDSYHCAFRV